MKMEFTAEMISGFLGGEIVGDKDAKVWTVSSLEGGDEGSLSYLINPKYEDLVYSTKATILLVDKSFEPREAVAATLVKVDSAAECVVKLMQMYEAAKPRKSGVSARASIAESVELSEELYVGDFAVLEEGVKVAKGVSIYPQCYIGDGVTIGEGTILYAGVKIYGGCHIGAGCIIHAGAVIGADGFGFLPNAEGGFDKIPQIGNVIIEDNVEIGANTCIDRAKTDSTIIKRGVKLDNLIQIGHNVVIGENTVSSAQMGIAGSSSIGSNCFLGGQVGIKDHVAIGSKVMIGSKSGIDKNIPDGEVRMGYPALPGIQFHKVSAAVKDLPEMMRTMRQLVKDVAALKSDE